MCKIICVTDRKSCRGGFVGQITRIANARPDGILLRDKDADPADYRTLLRNVQSICALAAVPLFAHSFADIAAECGVRALHLPLPQLLGMTTEKRGQFPVLGASSHSVDDARKAADCGASYLIAGHIFETDCKRGLPGRGLSFLRAVCEAVPLPVYAIGGISAENIADVLRAGAAGVCVMSGLMASADPVQTVSELRSAANAATA